MKLKTLLADSSDLNLTGREGKQVIDNMELKTGITSKVLVRDMSETFCASPAAKEEYLVTFEKFYLEKGERQPLTRRRISQFMNKQELIEEKKMQKWNRILEKQRQVKEKEKKQKDEEEAKLGIKKKPCLTVDDMFGEDGPIHTM